jgi:hypothetical protein
MEGTYIQVLEKFDLASIKDVDEVRLFNRIDTKFVVPEILFPKILELLIENYKVFQLNGLNCLPYLTQYYDTDDFKMYNNHVNGKLNRYKIRVRSYSATENSFLETKFKTNTGRIIKHRVAVDNNNDCLSGIEQGNLLKTTPYRKEQLNIKQYNRFKRIFLINKTVKERVTIDYGVKFSKNRQNWINLNNIIVVEVKQSRINRNTSIFRVMKENGIRSNGFSKYCIGNSLLYTGLKSNNLKYKLIHHKIGVYSSNID